MGVFELQDPNGQTFEIEGPDLQGAVKAFQQSQQPQQPQQQSQEQPSLEAPHPAGGLPAWMETLHSYIDPMRVLAGKAGQKAELQPAELLPALSMALPAGRAPGAALPGAIPQAAERIGVELPQAAVRGRVAQSVAQKVSQVPFVGAPLEKRALKANEQLAAAVERTAQGYGGGVSTPTAGAAARDSITNYMHGTTRAVQDRLYGAVSAHLDPNVRVPLTATENTVNYINARRQNAGLPESPAIKMVEEAATRPQGSNFEGIKDLRTSIGQKTKFDAVPSDMTNTEREMLYGSLSKDLQTSIQHGGPQAQAAFQKANSYSATISKTRQNLVRITRANSDEDVVNRIHAAAGATSRADLKLLQQARAATDPQTWDGVASAVISKLGRGADGKFSPDVFVTDWEKRLSPQGKAILFGSTGNSLKKSLDDIALVSSRVKQMQSYANTSKTAAAGALLTGLGGGTYAAYSGDWKTPLGAVATVLSGRVLAHVLAKPATAAALANWVRAYAQGPKALPIAAKALSIAIAEETNTSGLIPRITQALSGPEGQ